MHSNFLNFHRWKVNSCLLTQLRFLDGALRRVLKLNQMFWNRHLLKYFSLPYASCINFLELPYKWPQTGWPNTTEIYSLIVLETGSLKSGYPQGHSISKGSKKESFIPSTQLLVVAHNPWHSLPWEGSITPVAAFIFTWRSTFWVSGHASTSSDRSLVIGSGPTLIWYDFLIWPHLQIPCFQVRTYSPAPGEHKFGRSTVQPSTLALPILRRKFCSVW